MDTKYALHPHEPNINDTERFYEKMAAKGWQLVKRGALLSRFQRAAPCETRYRTAVALSADSNEIPFSEEQIAEYKHNGWEFVTGRGYLWVFRTNDKNNTSELPMDPEQKAETIKKLRKQSLRSLIQLPLSIVCFLVMGALLNSAGGQRHFAASIYRGWVEYTAGITALVLLFLLLAEGELRSIWYLRRLSLRLKAGLPSEQPAAAGGIFLKYVHRGLALSVLMFGILALWQWAGGSRYAMPPESDGPYLVLSDIGVEGERSQSFVQNRTSRVHFQQSLLSGHWNTFEVVQINGNEVWMQQDIYHINEPGMAARLAQTLLKDALFTDSLEGFTEVDIPGLDQAWVSPRLECAAVKGDFVCFITYPEYEQEQLRSILYAVAEKWSL